MRIVYLHQYFSTPAAPGGTRSYEMARRLVSRGHQVHMVTSDRSEAVDHDARWWTTDEAGITVHWTHVPYSNAMSYRERITSFFRFSLRAARKAAALEADVVFATSTPLTIALPAVYAARRSRVPMVFEVRDLWPELPIAIGALKGRTPKMAARWLERFAYRNAAAVVALSPGMRDGVVRAGVAPARIRVIPNGCDLELFAARAGEGLRFRSRYPWLGDRPLVVYTGTLGRINGVGYLADVAAVVQRRDPEVRFLIVGGGAEAEAVEEHARKLGVLGRSFFMEPRMPKEAMPACLAAADVATSLFVDLEEMWANSANKFFDALASGTPVMINYGGWQAGLLEESGAGLVVSPSDPPGAAGALLDLIGDWGRLQRMGSAARALARQQFDRDRLAREMEEVLDTAASST